MFFSFEVIVIEDNEHEYFPLVSNFEYDGASSTVSEQVRTPWSNFNSQRANTNDMEQF